MKNIRSDEFGKALKEACRKSNYELISGMAGRALYGFKGEQALTRFDKLKLSTLRYLSMRKRVIIACHKASLLKINNRIKAIENKQFEINWPEE